MNPIKRTLHFLNNHPIAKRNKLFAYYRFINWQIRSRLNNGDLCVMPFVAGTRFLAKRHLTGITGSIYTGLQDFEEMSFLLHFMRNDDCFFDVGSNVGAYTILASGVRSAKSLSFEPNGTTFDLLQKNIALNELQHLVQCENKAVGRSKGTIRFTIGGDTTNHVISRYESSEAYEEVSVDTLDSFAENWVPTMMKIDVEGFETEVLEGANSILSNEKLKVILIELNGSGGRYDFDESQVHRKLEKLSFAPYKYDPFTRQLARQNKPGDFNTLYIRDVEFVNERVKTGLSFKVWNTIL